MLKKVPGTNYSMDKVTGTMRSLSSYTGFLTEAKLGLKPSSVATDYIKSNAVLFGMKSDDLSSLKIMDEVYSKISGNTHIYMNQIYEGIPVYNGQMQVNLSKNKRIISVNNNAVSDLASSVNAVKSRITLANALTKAAQQVNFSVSTPPKIIKKAVGTQQITTIDHSGISLKTIEGRLMWLPIRKAMMHLVWNFQIYTLDQQHAFDFTVDAESGKIWTRFDWVASDQYRVYAMPAESPNHVSPLPPSDGRTLANNPANSNASPFNWHDTNGRTGAEFTTTRGNNVHAYTDVNADDIPDTGSSPNGGSSLDFNFPIDLNQSPDSYANAAVTNLFYWNNIIHDVQYQYGFDEVAGNFQTNNYGNGGLGGDAVRAEAQDGSGNNNANFLTPNDGTPPRMQMFLWNRSNPERDGDLDNSIIIHEYGHGISNRLVGGPSNANCLTNRQQPGEGLSDWWSLVYTAEVGDSGSDARGIGTYAFGEPITGEGIRTQRYSTNPAINNWTYESINGMRVPHGVGSVWAQAAWEVYWALVDHWGFDPNLYNAQGSAGNQRMMLYVNEGLKNTACNPTFTQVRDGIIDAAKVLHGGEDVCRIWTAFAAFGLGVDAISGGPDDTSPTNGFALPASCQIDTTAPTTAITSPRADTTVAGNVSITATANDAVGVTKVEFFIDNNLETTDNSAPFSFTWDTTTINDGSHSISSKAFDAAGNVGNSTAVTVRVRNRTDGVAVFDSSLKAPKCTTVSNSCNSENLLLGRNGEGPESNQPNTINNSCVDGTSGSFHIDESIDRIIVSTADGSDFAPGKSVTIEVKIWAWESPSDDQLDLYFAADANNPSWTFIRSITPTVAEEQTLKSSYTLPQGPLQAVRANFRYRQNRSSCSNGNFDDHDDLIFAVNSAGPGPGPVNTVFSDDFETNKGWVVNPNANDTATTGQWERGNPEATDSNGPKQLGTTVSGVNDLVTGRLAGRSIGSHDIDRGITSIQSPAINLPATGNINLTFQYYFAYFNSSNDDFLRVKVIGNTSSTIFEKLASSGRMDGSWTPVSLSLNAFAGQTVRILIEAADAGRGSIVEAGIDDVKVTKN
jgi:extracellular elastinolytic metalloproteinase